MACQQLLVAKDNNTGAAQYAADSTNLSQVQDPFTLASPGRQVHIFKDNLLLGQHSQGSSEDTSPPPHAGSTALSNYSAIAQPAGHQNQTADPQVQLQSQSEEPSETVQNVTVEPWTGKQLLTILMISAATMALIRQAGHPSSSLGSSFILEVSKVMLCSLPSFYRFCQILTYRLSDHMHRGLETSQ